MADAPEPDGVRRGDLVRWLDQHDAATFREVVDDASLSALGAIPARVSISGTILQLSTDLWRDFMPMSPPDGKPLIAVVRVSTDVSEALPPAIRADRIAVIHGRQAWIAPVVEELPESRGRSDLSVVARNGPKWGPGVLVDVVLELRDGDGHAHLIRAPDQPIERTD